MTTQAVDDKWLARRNDWIDRVTRLADEVEQWAIAEGWAVHRAEKHLKESMAGEYRVPTLQLRTQGGNLFVTPVALHVVGADGRVDIEAWPTLNRVRLIGKPDGWQIITDSNVPIRQPWNRDTFIQLARDLQS